MQVERPRNNNNTIPQQKIEAYAYEQKWLI